MTKRREFADIPFERRRIAVVGCGHVGLVLAAGMTKLGHQVVGLDRDGRVVARLKRGETPFFEDGLDGLVQEGLGSGQLTFTESYDVAVDEADFVFLAVDTPPASNGAPDLTNLRRAGASLASALKGARPLVVIKSTVPVGTAALLEQILSASGGTPGRTRVVANPEFLRQGQAVHDFFNPDRMVIGATDPADAQAVADLFSALPGALVLTDVGTAEMIKYASNAYLATRLSFINEIAAVCDALGVDIDGVVKGMGYDPRIGHAFNRPGIGFGGSCLPKDIAAARHVAAVHGVNTPLLAAVESVNANQPQRAVRRLRAEIGDLDGLTIAIWGVTFKGGTDDARQSPALDVVRLLLSDGAHIRIYDPSAVVGLPEDLRDAVRADPLIAAADADALAVLSDWSEFADVDFRMLRSVMRGDVILDGRNTLNAQGAMDAGFRYLGIGRGNSSPAAERLLAVRVERLGASSLTTSLPNSSMDESLAETDSAPLPLESALQG